MHTKYVICSCLILAVLLLPTPRSQAGLLIGGAYDGTIYDIDPATGLASNPRSTGVDWLMGHAGTLYTIDKSNGDVLSSVLLSQSMPLAVHAFDSDGSLFAVYSEVLAEPTFIPSIAYPAW